MRKFIIFIFLLLSPLLCRAESGGWQGIYLDDLTDVNSSSPTDGDILKYDAALYEWRAQTNSASSGTTTYLNQSVEVGNNSKLNFIAGANIEIVATNSTDGVNYTFASTASGTGNVSQKGAVNADYFASWDSTGLIENSTYSLVNAANWQIAYNHTLNWTASPAFNISFTDLINWNATGNKTWVNDTWQADKTNYYNKTLLDGTFFNTTRNNTDTITAGSTNLFVTGADKTKWNNTDNKTWANESTTVGDTSTVDLTLAGGQVSAVVLGAGIVSIPLNNGTGTTPPASYIVANHMTGYPFVNLTGHNNTTDDTAYGAGWDSNTTAPSKNAVYDQMELKLNISGTGAGLTGVNNITDYAINDADINNLSDTKRAAFTFTIGDGVSTLVSNVTNSSITIPSFPMNMTITEWTVMGDVVGNCTIEVYKNSTLPILIANGFNGTTPIKLVDSQYNSTTTLTGWNITIAAGEQFRANYTTGTDVKQISVTIRGYKD
jgi:hypothetical protein